MISAILLITLTSSSCVKESSTIHSDEGNLENRIEARNTLAPSDCFQENSKEADQKVIDEVRKFAEQKHVPLNWDEMSYSTCGERIVVLLLFLCVHQQNNKYVPAGE